MRNLTTKLLSSRRVPREALDIVVDTSITAGRVVRVLELLKSQRGVPKSIRVDNGPEMTAQAFADWCRENEVRIDYTRQAEPERVHRTLQPDLPDRSARSAYILVALAGAGHLAAQLPRGTSPQTVGNIPPSDFKRRLLAENSSLDL